MNAMLTKTCIKCVLHFSVLYIIYKPLTPVRNFQCLSKHESLLGKYVGLVHSWLSLGDAAAASPSLGAGD